MKKSFVWCLMVVFLLVPCLAVGASDYPKGPITYVIPFNPGGQSDVEARLQQPYLEKILGVKIVVEYKPGAPTARQGTSKKTTIRHQTRLFFITSSSINGFKIRSTAFSHDGYRKGPTRDILYLFSSHPLLELLTTPADPGYKGRYQ